MYLLAFTSIECYQINIHHYCLYHIRTKSNLIPSFYKGVNYYGIFQKAKKYFGGHCITRIKSGLISLT